MNDINESDLQAFPKSDQILSFTETGRIPRGPHLPRMLHMIHDSVVFTAQQGMGPDQVPYLMDFDYGAVEMRVLAASKDTTLQDWCEAFGIPIEIGYSARQDPMFLMCPTNSEQGRELVKVLERAKKFDDALTDVESSEVMRLAWRQCEVLFFK